MCQVENEPARPIQLIMTGDGNTSLSRLRHHFEGDACMFVSDYYIAREDVDRFAGAQKHLRQGASSQVSVSFTASVFNNGYWLCLRQERTH
jgi:hypothetical protein